MEKAAGKTDDRELQCTAAEILAGIVRASHSLSAADQTQLKGKLAPLFISSLTALATETVGAWSEMVSIVTSLGPACVNRLEA